MKFYLIDRVTKVIPGVEAEAIKCVSLTDRIFDDHFPDYPILAGSLILEAFAQLGGFLLETTINKDAPSDAEAVRSMVAQIIKTSFYQKTIPGDKLILNAKIESLESAFAEVSFTANCDGEIRAKGKIRFSLSIIREEEFNRQIRKRFELWTRNIDQRSLSN